MALVFLSYRREDTEYAAQALYAQLKVRFGSGQLFMDRNSMSAGTEWPSHIQHAAERATGMLAICGPRWLNAADQWGRRRLDASNDWVLHELRAALQRKIPVIPVIVGNRFKIPPAEAMPSDIAGLFRRNAHTVRRKSWIEDINALEKVCIAEMKLVERSELKDVIAPYPDPAKAKMKQVAEDVLSKFLKRSSGWEPWEDALSREYPYGRQELVKNFVFESFHHALDFMREAADMFEKEQHHPRWNNEWRLVTIRLTTWDAGNRITEYDLRVAKLVDRHYKNFMDRSKKRRRKRASK